MTKLKTVTVDELCVLAAECLGMKQDRWGYWEYSNGKSIWVENTPFIGSILPIILSSDGRELMEEEAEKQGWEWEARNWGDNKNYAYGFGNPFFDSNAREIWAEHKSKHIACTLAFVRMCGKDVELEGGE